MMKPISIADARSVFFQETDDSVSVFRKSGWVGCVLDRNKYDYHGMSELLWNLIRTCCNSEQWQIYGYEPVGESWNSSVLVEPVWDRFIFPENPAVNSPVWIALDDSCEWALLADSDVTIFGCTQEIARNASKFLDGYETSLRKISEADFPNSKNWSFFQSVFLSNG